MRAASYTTSHAAIDAGINVGSFADETAFANAPTPRRLVITTYNIRYAVGSYLITGSLLRRLHISLPARRARLVERHLERAARAFTADRYMPPADIIALQEADARTVRAGRHDIATELARRLQMHYAFAGMNTPRDIAEQPKKWYLDFEEHIEADDTGDTGVALLSTLPFANIARLDLPWQICPWRPRLSIYSEFRVGSTPLYLFNSHIDTHASIDAQLMQHEAVLEKAEKCAADGAPTILVGDFNTLTRRSVLHVRRFLEARGFTTPFRTGTTTWRTGLIRLQPDWIFTCNVETTNFGVLRPLGVSDHFPLWIEIDSSRF